MSDHASPNLPLDRRTLLRGAGAAGLAVIIPSSGEAASFGAADPIQKIIDEKIAARKFPGAVVSLDRETARLM